MNGLTGGRTDGCTDERMDGWTVKGNAQKIKEQAKSNEIKMNQHVCVYLCVILCMYVCMCVSE